MNKQLIFIFMLLAHFPDFGQTKLFDLNKLENGELKDFFLQKKIIVIGEMHGTMEVPHFVLQLVRLLAEENKPFEVALEINSNHQNEIDDFMKNGNFDELIELDYFKVKDGRSSIAMGELLKGLRNIKGIRIICFDIESTLGNVTYRDSLMAVNLFNHYNGGQLIIFTGNLHALQQEVSWRPGFKSAIIHFDQMMNSGDKLISLNACFGGGTIWNCMKDGCREREAYSNPNMRQNSGLDNFIGIYKGVDHSGYGGFIFFDKVKASPPLLN